MSVRHEFQAEVYSTQQRLTRLQSDVTDALATLQLDTSQTSVTNRIATLRGKLVLIVNCAFFSKTDGQTIMDTCISRAQVAQAVVPSYIWLASVDSATPTTVERRQAAATDWAVTTTIETS